MNDRAPPPGEGIPLVRDALAAARAAAPDEAFRARVLARVATAVAPPGGGGGSAGGPAGPASALPAPAPAAPSVLSGALIGAVLGALVSGAVLLRPDDPAGAPRARVALPEAREAEAPARRVDAPRLEAPSVAAGPGTTAVAHVEPRAPRSLAGIAATTGPAVPPPAPGAPAEGAGTAVAPLPEAHAEAAAGAPETEVELLQRAQGALAASPAQALALTREHAARFPGGAFSQEREVVAIQALLRLGQAQDARARGARFVAAYPGSAHRRRIQALLGP